MSFAIFKQELRLQLRQRSDLAALVLFFGSVILLLPFVIGPDTVLLGRLAPGLIWFAALLMSLLGLENLFKAEARDGTLDQMLLSPLPLSLLVLAKLAAHSLVMIVALIVMLLPASLLLGLSPNILPILIITEILGVPVLVLLGGVASAITVGLPRSPALLTLLLVPFYIPVVIFAVGACEATSLGTSPCAHLALLAAMFTFVLVSAPFVTAAALRQSVR